MRVSSILIILLWLWAMPIGAERVSPRTASRQPLQQARLAVHIAHLFDGKPLEMETVSLRNRAGNTFSITRLAYLISDVTLLRADGSTVTLSNQPVYINPAEGRETFTLDSVPAGRYAGLSFHIGLPPSLNHADPSRYPANHPLHPLVNRLHWGWQGGYVFLALEGRYRQSDGKLSGYSYHLATDKNLMAVRLNQNFRIERNSAINLAFDVANVFSAAQVIAIQPNGGGDSTHSAPGDKLAAQLKSNVERAFAALTPGVHFGHPLPKTQARSRARRGGRAIVKVIPGTSRHRFAHSDRRITSKYLCRLERRTANRPADEETVGLFTPQGSSATPAPHLTPFSFPLPAHFPQPDLPKDNPLTVEGVALGQKLFFDTRLSGNNTQSCASCHQPEYAFANGGKAVSVGIDGKPGIRRAMPLFNLAWQSAFTWDGRRTRLRDQVLAPIQDVREMRQTLAATVGKLQADAKYPQLFGVVFGSFGNSANLKANISAKRIGLAIEQYLLTLVAADAKFDRALRGEAQFTDEEKRGLLLFITEYDPARGKTGADCFHCHGGNLFTDYQFRNNGLDAQVKAGSSEGGKDAGRFLVTGREADRGKFKTPSLRNVELTAPYMHDGRFRSLEDVVRHYSAGIQRSDTLDPNIAKHPDSGMALSDADVKALVAFLKTLTDEKWRSTQTVTKTLQTLHPPP